MSATKLADLRSRSGALRSALREKREATPRAELRARRFALGAELARRLQRAKEEINRRRAGIKPVPERRRRWWLLLGLLLLFPLFWDCQGPPPLVAAPPLTEDPAALSPAETATQPPAPPPVKRRSRPAFRLADPGRAPWLGEFRIQVAARSSRLGACLNGAETGALRWTGAVDPTLGRVSDQQVDPTLGGAPLTEAQRTCVEGVLAEPPYRLAPDGPTLATPLRVAMVVEF